MKKLICSIIIILVSALFMYSYVVAANVGPYTEAENLEQARDAGQGDVKKTDISEEPTDASEEAGKGAVATKADKDKDNKAKKPATPAPTN